MPGWATTSPRWSAARSSPWRLMAVRCPAPALCCASLCTWMPRTLAWMRWGRTSTVSPTVTCPDTRVPVTTLPNPFMVKTRSTGIRNNPLSPRSPIRRASSSMAAESSAIPWPDTADTGMIGAPSRKVAFMN